MHGPPVHKKRPESNDRRPLLSSGVCTLRRRHRLATLGHQGLSLCIGMLHPTTTLLFPLSPPLPLTGEMGGGQVFYPAEEYHQQYLAKGGRRGRPQSAAKGCNDPIRCYG